MVPTVKDPSSDFALCARNGSATLRHQREKREKGKMRQRFWELGGSRMGKAMGVEDKAGDDKKEAEQKEEVGRFCFALTIKKKIVAGAVVYFTCMICFEKCVIL